jgi:hypothetical protein
LSGTIGFTGNLKQFLESHEEAMMDSFSKAYGEASMKILQKNLDYEKTVLSPRMASNEVWHDTLDMWLAFNYPEAKTSAWHWVPSKIIFLFTTLTP